MRIEVTNLRKSYWMDQQELPVLNGVNTVIQSGELISITGHSGVGKSTFLHVVGTLDTPTSGTVSYDGKDVFAGSRASISDFRNRRIGFVFQFHHLLPEFTALENVMMPALVQRLDKKDAQARAESMLEDVGLGNRVKHRPGELSGGEQQRVALARALVLSPSLLLADEPTGNLDEGTGGAIHELLFKVNALHKVTIVVVTHSTALAQRMPRRLHMEGGLIVSDSSAPPVVAETVGAVGEGNGG